MSIYLRRIDTLRKQEKTDASFDMNPHSGGAFDRNLSYFCCDCLYRTLEVEDHRCAWISARSFAMQEEHGVRGPKSFVFALDIHQQGRLRRYRQCCTFDQLEFVGIATDDTHRIRQRLCAGIRYLHLRCGRFVKNAIELYRTLGQIIWQAFVEATDEQAHADGIGACHIQGLKVVLETQL